MNSHPPLAESHDITRQREAFSALFTPSPAETLVVMACPRAQSVGRQYTLDVDAGALVLGRDVSADITVASDAVSRRHCKLSREGGAWWIEDLRSTNGTLVNDAPVTRAALRAGDQIRVGDTVFKLLGGGDLEAAMLDRMLRDVVRDPLTQAFTRGYFNDTAESVLQEVRTSQGRGTLLLVDIDHFKRINDLWGHVCGDLVLREAAARMSGELPHDAVFGRLGGEEFGALLPAFGAASARMVAEKVRRAVCATPIGVGDASITVTCSVGLAEGARTMHDLDAWVRVADDHLYEAKRGGRNRVVG